MNIRVVIDLTEEDIKKAIIHEIHDRQPKIRIEPDDVTLCTDSNTFSATVEGTVNE